MRIAYLVNQYPHISHSFIRREIVAMEALGTEVVRISIRRTTQALPDPADMAEGQRTRALLGVSAIGFISSSMRAVLGRPLRFARALGTAISLGWRSDRGILRHLMYLAEACVMLRWMQEGQVEHVHAHFGTNSAAVAMLCYLLGGPSYSFTVHGPEEFDRPDMLSLRKKIELAEFVVAVSDFGRSQLYRWCLFSQWQKIYVIRCGVDDEFLSSPMSPIPRVPRFVCIGRLCEQKGQLLLVEAIAKLAAEGRECEIVFVGDGPMRGEIEKRIHHLGLHKYVKLLGWMDGRQVRDQILASRAMVLPSFAEGLPVVIMESLAMRRPVISTYVAGIPELVEPRKCGWLVPPGAVDALVSAMQEAIDAPIELLEEMGRFGAARVAERHNATVEAAKLANLFSESIRRNGEAVAGPQA